MNGMLLTKKTLTVSDVASVMNVSSATVYKWIHTRELKAFLIGKKWHIYEEEFNRFLKSLTNI